LANSVISSVTEHIKDPSIYYWLVVGCVAPDCAAPGDWQRLMIESLRRLYMGCSDVSEFEHIYGQMSTTPSCVYDQLFKEQEWWLLMRWSCERNL